MKQIEIMITNRTIDGGWQWLYFLLMDINDFIGMPFVFVIGDGNTFKNFNIDAFRWKTSSTKYAFGKFLKDTSEESK